MFGNPFLQPRLDSWRDQLVKRRPLRFYDTDVSCQASEQTTHSGRRRSHDTASYADGMWNLMNLRGRKQTEEHIRKRVLARSWYRPSEQTKEKLRRIRAKQVFGPEWRIRKSLTAKRLGTRPPVLFGPDHPRWRGGHTRNKYGGDICARWRKSVFERDDYRCVLCGARCGEGKKVILQADHIKPWALYPALRFDLNNGRTLCVNCHRKTPTYGNKSMYRKKDLMGMGV